MTDDNKPRTVYDWIIACGGQVDYCHGAHYGWFQNDAAEELAYRPIPHEMQTNGVVLTFEMLEVLKQIELPDGFPVVPDDPWRFWYDLHNGKYLKGGDG